MRSHPKKRQVVRLDAAPRGDTSYVFVLNIRFVSIFDERFSLSTLPGILKRGDSTTPNSLPSRDYLASAQWPVARPQLDAATGLVL